MVTCDWPRNTNTNIEGAVVRALASHQHVPGSIPGPGVICVLSLLLVLYSAARGFSLGTPVFPSPQKPTFPTYNSILECTGISARVFVNSWCSVGKRITFTFTIRFTPTYLSSGKFKCTAYNERLN